MPTSLYAKFGIKKKTAKAGDLIKAARIYSKEKAEKKEEGKKHESKESKLERKVEKKIDKKVNKKTKLLM